MGSYLSEPVTTKESATGSVESHTWGSSCMQGWRVGMEDAHVTLSDLGDAFKDLSNDLKGIGFFAVYDGHGGKEVAQFCKQHMPEEFAKIGTAKGFDQVDGALTDVFHRMDDMLREPEYQAELRQFKQVGKRTSTNQDDSGLSRAASLLQNSIDQSLEQVSVKGVVSRKEANDVLMKQTLKKMILQKAEASAARSSIAGEPQAEATADNVGCTAVCVLLCPSEVICANAGDSRAILCRKGRPVELSHDHKPNNSAEKARIENAGAVVEEKKNGNRTMYRVNGNLNLARSIGDLEYKQRLDLPPSKQAICATPQIIHEPITSDDEFLVIACDGIWDVKSNQEVCNFVRARFINGHPIEQIIEQLLDSCMTTDPKKTQGLGADNMSCIIVQLHQWQVDQTPSCACNIQ